MSRISKLAIPAALLLGALGGWLAGSGQLSALLPTGGRSVRAAAPPAAEAEGCCDGGRQQLVAYQEKSGKKPNVVFIMGDDVGWFNIGAYHRGMMSGKTPNLDRLASQGMLLTDYYAE